MGRGLPDILKCPRRLGSVVADKKSRGQPTSCGLLAWELDEGPTTHGKKSTCYEMLCRASELGGSSVAATGDTMGKKRNAYSGFRDET
jgi:hypothetical protein